MKHKTENTQTGGGTLIVISGPSGSGKGSITQKLLERKPRLSLSVSMTTRAPRTGEREGVDYFFRSETEFLNIAREDGFLEYKHVFGHNYYGTPRAYVERQRALGKDVLLEIDVKGALDVKNAVPDAILIFIMPPSFQELEKRLRKRGTEDETAISARMKTAVEELKSACLYDYFVINDTLERAVRDIHMILAVSRMEARRRRDVIGEIMEGDRQI